MSLLRERKTRGVFDLFVFRILKSIMQMTIRVVFLESEDIFQPDG